MRVFFIVATCALAGGCAASDGQPHSALSQAPIETAELRGDYQKIAACVYGKIVDGTANVVQRNEFPESKQTRLAAMGGSTKQWELILTQTGPKTTKAELTAVQTMWGPDKLSTKDVMTTAQGCQGR